MRHYFLYLLPFFLSLFITDARAQRHGAYAAAGTEFTVGGNFWGFQAGVELNRHRFGVLYELRFDAEKNPYNEDYNLKALVYEYTFYREKHLNMGVMLRSGLSNDQFVVVVPALTTAFIFNDYLKLNMITGVRGEKPAIGFNLFFNIPFKKHEYPHPIFNF